MTKFKDKVLSLIQPKNFCEVNPLCQYSMQHECHKTPETLVKQAIKYCTSCCIPSTEDAFKKVEKITQI
jgi:ABC-type dipeptide/oligopeptide/nickel transport system ATPase component